MVTFVLVDTTVVTILKSGEIALPLEPGLDRQSSGTPRSSRLESPDATTTPLSTLDALPLVKYSSSAGAPPARLGPSITGSELPVAEAACWKTAVDPVTCIPNVTGGDCIVQGCELASLSQAERSAARFGARRLVSFVRFSFHQCAPLVAGTRSDPMGLTAALGN
jgi:hypothetical protein